MRLAGRVTDRGRGHQHVSVALPDRDAGALDQPVDRDRQHGRDALDVLLQRQCRAQLEQRLRDVGRLLLLGDQAHVLAGDGGVRGDHLEQAQVVVVEPGQTLLAEHDHAHGSVLGHHRRHQHRLVDRFGARDLDAEGHGRRVVDPQRLPRLEHAAGDALADRDHQILDVLAGVDLAHAHQRGRQQQVSVLRDDVEPARVVVDQRVQLPDDDPPNLGQRPHPDEGSGQRSHELHLLERAVAASGLPGRHRLLEQHVLARGRHCGHHLKT